MSDNNVKPEGEVIPIRPDVKPQDDSRPRLGPKVGAPRGPAAPPTLTVVPTPAPQGSGYVMYRKVSDLVWRYRVAIGWSAGGFLAGWLVFRGKK